MIKSFTLRDIPLVHRLSEQGIVFHAESALTQDVRPLREALVHMLIGGQFPTYVWKDDTGDGVGFAQLRQDEDESHAHIICLGSTIGDDNTPDEAVWVPFLEQLTAEAGRQGMHSLIAEVNEDGDELPVLRQAGFAVYTRQDVWVMHRPTDKEVDNSHEKSQTLIPATSVDEWDIHLLYANTVPRLIQLVEPVPPTHLQDVWILREKDELAAFVHFKDGSAATWLRVYIHPNAQTRGDEILEMAAKVRPPKENHPLYCCVRRYQSWVQTNLDKVGFEYLNSQALMVKHTVRHTRKLSPALKDQVQTEGVPARRHSFVGPQQKSDEYHQVQSYQQKRKNKAQQHKTNGKVT